MNRLTVSNVQDYLDGNPVLVKDVHQLGGTEIDIFSEDTLIDTYSVTTLICYETGEELYIA
jgi:hypothetical protein